MDRLKHMYLMRSERVADAQLMLIVLRRRRVGSEFLSTIPLFKHQKCICPEQRDCRRCIVDVHAEAIFDTPLLALDRGNMFKEHR